MVVAMSRKRCQGDRGINVRVQFPHVYAAKAP